MNLSNLKFSNEFFIGYTHKMENIYNHILNNGSIVDNIDYNTNQPYCTLYESGFIEKYYKKKFECSQIEDLSQLSQILENNKKEFCVFPSPT